MTADDVLTIARSQLGVTEAARNSGPQIDLYLADVQLGPGYPWCAAFVSWCFDQAGGADPRTAGCWHMWRSYIARRAEAPAPGLVFILDHGHGLGHCGIVETVNGDGTLTTIEGNTNADGSREGDCVARHTWRPGIRPGLLLGYLDFLS
jgi:hypothetical protein